MDESLKKQLEEQRKDLEAHKKTYEIKLKEKELNDKLFMIVNEHPKPLKFEHEYQELDDYWALQKELRELRKAREDINFDMELNHLLKTINAKEEELKRLEEGINDE